MKTYSDAKQDIFALTLLSSKRFYLELGCGDGLTSQGLGGNSNTLLLEENGWSGILVDNNPALCNIARSKRLNSKVYTADATNSAEIESILSQSNAPQIIDYISLDIDEASLPAIGAFPFHKYKFKFMTFEHDLYSGRQDSIDRKNITPIFLKEKGYERLIDGIVIGGHGPFEDWYISEEYTDLISLFKGVSNITPDEALNILIDSKLKIL